MQKEWATKLVIDSIVAHEHICEEDFKLENSAQEIGADSLDVIEIIMEVEERIQELTGVPFDFNPREASKIGKATKLEEFVRMVEQYGPSISSGITSQPIQ